MVVFGVKQQRSASCGFAYQMKKVNARGYIPLRSDFVVRAFRFATSVQVPGKYPDDASPPLAIIVSIILPLRLSSMGFPDINVLPLLFTENAIIESFIKC